MRAFFPVHQNAQIFGDRAAHLCLAQMPLDWMSSEHGIPVTLLTGCNSNAMMLYPALAR